MYNMDRLFEAVAAKGHVCAGLDTAADYVPPRERQKAPSDAEAILSFNKALIDATIDVAACYKVQIAYYEELGLGGLKTYAETLRYIRSQGALVIADIKRGDIADTALRYARAHFEGEFEADFVTLSPYMGMDSIEPWFSYADSRGKGAFVLLRTSNKGMKDFEDLSIDQGETGRRDYKLYHAVGDKIASLAAGARGVHRYLAFGAVVGAEAKSPAEKKEAAAIRAKWPELFFLIPGYGAQGGAADDAALLLREGNGGVVNASRSILKAWTAASEKRGASPDEADNAFAAEEAGKAAINMRDAIRAAVKAAGETLPMGNGL